MAAPDRPLLVVAGALIDAAGRVCLQRRPQAKQHGGLWEFPGGKVEPGEAPDAALCRELAEELAITISPVDLHPCGFAASERIVILLYRCDRWDGCPAPVEGEALRWVVPAAAAQLAMPPLDYPLAAQLVRQLAKAANPSKGDLGIAKPDALS